jgi:hypothetical protein
MAEVLCQNGLIWLAMLVFIPQPDFLYAKFVDHLKNRNIVFVHLGSGAMKKLFLSALIAGLAASHVQADEGFGDAELRSLAPFFEEAQCQTRCDTTDWVIERVTMPRGAKTVAPDDRLYNVYTQPHGCGAGRCYEAFVLRDSSNLTVIKHGLSISPLRAREIPAPAGRSQLTRINRVSSASNGSQVRPPRPSSKGPGFAIVDVEVTANARVRDHPTTNGSGVLGVITAGRFLSGEWVPDDDGNGRWLRVDLGSLDEIQGQSSWPYGYIWDGNLRPAQLSSNGPGAAGPSSTLRSDLQARADRFYAAADLSSALEALADILGVLTKMRDAGDLYLATQVFEIYDARGSELALADMTRKNVWTLAQLISTGLLKGWYARAKETGRKAPIRYEYAEVMVQNVLYAARAGSGDVPGAIADASGDQIDRIKEIAIIYQQIRGQNELLVHNALNSALLDLGRYSRGELDYKFVLQNIINSRQIATNLDSTTRRVMRDDTSTRLAIVADLQEIKLKVLRGDDVSVLLESVKAQYQDNAFARDAAFLLGVPGWNNAIGTSAGSDRKFPEGRKFVSLTTINTALMIDCFISLDERGQAIVGFSRGNFWRFGINNQVYHFDLEDSSYDQASGEFTVFDKRRGISVALKPVGRRSTRGFDYDLIDVNIIFDNLRAKLHGFRFCQAGN